MTQRVTFTRQNIMCLLNLTNIINSSKIIKLVADKFNAI